MVRRRDLLKDLSRKAGSVGTQSPTPAPWLLTTAAGGPGHYLLGGHPGHQGPAPARGPGDQQEGDAHQERGQGDAEVSGCQQDHDYRLSTTLLLGYSGVATNILRSDLDWMM